MSERISQPNARILLGVVNDLKLKYAYDGYTHACEYQPIRKKKVRNKIRKEFHAAGLNKEAAQELAGKLVQLDELVNAETYKEFETYLNAMFDDVHYPFGSLCDLSHRFKACHNLQEAYNNTYRYISENY